MPGTPTKDDILGKIEFFMEWPKPIKKWDEYGDWAMFIFLETAHLIIAGAESTEFVPALNQITVPALKIASPLGGGVITTNALSGATINDGQFVYITNVEFPIKSNTTKSLSVGSLSDKDNRRADRIFLGVRDGDTMYFRTMLGSTAGGLRFKETDFIPIEWAEDLTKYSAPDAAELLEDDDGAVRVRKFSGTTSQYVVLPWEVPEDIVVSAGIEYQVVGFFTDAVFSAISSHTLLFRLSGYSIGHGDPLDGSSGTYQVASLSGETHAQNDRFALDWSPTVTISNLARGELGMLLFRRDASDVYPSPVGIYGVKIRYMREARQ
jgi:hypothetical protein